MLVKRSLEPYPTPQWCMLGSNKEKNIISYPMQDITHLEGSPDQTQEALPIREAAPRVLPFWPLNPFLRYPMSQCWPRAQTQLSEESSSGRQALWHGDSSKHFRSAWELNPALSTFTGQPYKIPSSNAQRQGETTSGAETSFQHWFWQSQVTTGWYLNTMGRRTKELLLTSQMERVRSFP